MTDIVDRLENPMWVTDTNPDGPRPRLQEDQTQADMREAAAEIKHLRSTIVILRRMCGPVSIERPFTEIKQELKEKQNVSSS